MSGTPLVQQSDVEQALLRPLTTTEAEYISGLCDQASARLRARMPAIDTRIAVYNVGPSGIGPDAVSAMLAEVIVRVLVNPKRLWSTSDTAGPFTHSETYPGQRGGAQAQTAGGVIITDDDLAQLLPASGLAAGTICTPPRAPHCPVRW